MCTALINGDIVSTLSYQITGYDCGTTTILNGIRTLFKMEQTPPDITNKRECLLLFNTEVQNGG